MTSANYYTQTISEKTVIEYNSEGFLTKLYDEASALTSFLDEFKIMGLTDMTVETLMDTAVTYSKE